MLEATVWKEAGGLALLPTHSLLCGPAPFPLPAGVASALS